MSPTRFLSSPAAFTAGAVALALGIGMLVGRYALRPGDSAFRREMGRDAPTRTDVRTVVARGRLEPDGGVISVGVPMGDRLNRMVVKEGQFVKAGEELAYLESHSDRLADVKLAKSQLDEASRRLTAVKDAAQCAIDEAEIRKEQVEKVEPLDIKAQAARVRLLEEQLSTARTDLARLQALKLDSVPQQQIEMQTLAVRKAEEELIAARALLDKVKAGHDLSLRGAEAQVRAARANLARYEAEIPVASLKQTLALAEVRLGHTVIRAPADGKVLKLVSRAGEMLGAQPILQMGNTRSMTAVAEVYETDVQHLKVGNTATVTSPALPKPVQGKVVSIGSVVQKNRLFDLDPTAAADHRVVDVKIQLDADGPAEQFVNLQVTVSIEVSGSGVSPAQAKK